jgi:hypothetical protein
MSTSRKIEKIEKKRRRKVRRDNAEGILRLKGRKRAKEK